MNESCAPRAEKKLLVAADMLFFLLLLTEWLVKHTLVSQLVLAAFVLVVLTLAVRTKKLYLSQWFAFSIAMIAFGALMPHIVIGQFAAKVGGGFIWSLLIGRRREVVA